MCTCVVDDNVKEGSLSYICVLHNVVTVHINDHRFSTPVDPSNTAASSSSSSSDKGGDQSVYKVPEYYQYNEDSYYDIEMDMLKYRLEQPHPGGKY